MNAKRDEGRKTKRNKLVIGALVAGTAIDMTSGSVYAHGNRSSHGLAARVTLGPDDYILMREAILAPNAETTKLLNEATNTISQLQESDPNFDQNPEYLAANATKSRIESELSFRPLTKEVVMFLEMGDLDAAVATVEGVGSVDQVLEAYRWTMLDLANTKTDLQDITKPPKRLNEIMGIAQHATNYCANALEEAKSERNEPRAYTIRTKVAEIFHNIGSLTHPSSSIDEVPLEHRKIGKKCAEHALEIRESLGQLKEITRAKVLLGDVRVGEGRKLEAIALFSEAVTESRANAEKDQEAIGLAKVAGLIANENVDAARARLLEARELYDSLPDSIRLDLDQRLVPGLLDIQRSRLEELENLDSDDLRIRGIRYDEDGNRIGGPGN